MNDRPRVLVASTNRGKLQEIRDILIGMPVRWVSLSDVTPISFPEEGDDYRENALAKAATAARASGLIAVADDSGLEVEALGRAPGPRSARYGGPGLDDRGRVAALLEAVRDVPAGKRGARFVCHAAFAVPGGESIAAFGECRGLLLEAPRGAGGFGYDPVFRLEDRAETMAELDPAEKNRLSHRARALHALEPALRRALQISI